MHGKKLVQKIMSILHKIELSCKKATLLISKEQENSISFKEKILMHKHFLICSVCALFYKQSNLLQAVLKTLRKEEDTEELIELNEQQKNKLQNIVDRELK